MKRVDKHAHGPLTTKRNGVPLRSKHVRDRIRRWAKRVLKRQDQVQSQDD